MSLAYPIARSLEEATLPGAKIARTQREAARLLRVDERTARKWCTGERQMPWAAGELLRRLLA